MSRRSMSAALIAAIALLGVFSSGAMAASTHSHAVSRSGKAQNAHQTKTHYVLSYTDEKWGPVKCTGVHIVSAAYPGTATTGGADKFKCKSTSKKPVTFGNANEELINPTEWASDYFTGIGHFVIAKSLVIKMSSNLKSYTGFAVYPSPAEEAQKAKEQKEKEEKEAAEKAQKEKEEKEKAEEEEPSEEV